MKELGEYHTHKGRLLQKLDGKIERKLRARRAERTSFWTGLKTAGRIGWSVVLPALLGVAAGAWIDSRWPGRHSWTVMLLFAGVALGCFGAWRWIEQERLRIRYRDEEDAP
jgi:ATP synthase protein I